MMRWPRPLVVLTFASLIASIGCGKSSSPAPSVTISPGGTVTLDAGQSINFTASVTNDGTTSGVSWATLQNGTLTNSTNFATTYAAPATLTGSYTSSVIATSLSNAKSYAATAINLFPALSVTKPAPTAAKVGIAYTYTFASTGGAAPITWTVTSGALPGGLTLASNGVLSGTPTTAGTFTFTVTTTDSATAPVSISSAVSITVTTPALAITTTSVPNAEVGVSYTTSLTNVGGVTPLTWSITSGALPAGLTLSPNGVLSGTPTASGTFTFTAQVADSGSTVQKATQSYTLLVYASLAITSPATLPQGSLKNAYNTTLTVAGGQPTITWKLVSGSLPAGLTLSTAGVISGTPTTAGDSTFTAQATDSFSTPQTTSATFKITVIVSSLAITTTAVAPGTVGTAYSSTLQSSGGNAPVTWSVTSGGLPAGLQLASNSGVISGTPTAAGTSNFTVQASDTTPYSTTATLSIKVIPATDLKITTASLPAANLGSTYSQTLNATLGTPPYTWSIINGTLPAGFALNANTGTITGTTVIAGTYNLTFAVTDSIGGSVTQALPIIVGTTLAPGPNNAQLTGRYAFQINGATSGKAAGQTYGFSTIGSLAFDGAGNVTGIEDTNSSTGAQSSVTVTGTYTLGSDGRGLMVLSSPSTVVYSLASSSPSSGVDQYFSLSEFDNSTGDGTIASGRGYRQTASAFVSSTLSGGFAFGTAGESPCASCSTPAPLFGPISLIGYFTGNGVSTLTGGADAGAYGKSYSGITLAGAFTTPSASTGLGTLTLTQSGTTFAAPPVNYTYVIVNANHILLLSTDSHAAKSLLYGEARKQQQATYTAATAFSGRSIGYEVQAIGGDGATIAPTASAGILTQLTYNASGTATITQDSNKAGTVFSTNGVAATYAVTATGRTTLSFAGTPTQVAYLYDTGSGFVMDIPDPGVFPAVGRYEAQVTTSTSLPPLLYGTFAEGTIATPHAAVSTTGQASFTFYTGGVSTSINGQIAAVADTSTPAGSLSFGQSKSWVYLEDLTGRMVLTDATSNNVLGFVYAITPTSAIMLPGSSDTSPSLIELQQ